MLGGPHHSPGRVTAELHRADEIADQDRHPDPDSIVRGMGPRIRIRTKISWIRNTDEKCYIHRGDSSFLTLLCALFQLGQNHLSSVMLWMLSEKFGMKAP